MKIWQRHMTLLKTKDREVMTTRNTLVNYLHLLLTHIIIKLIYTAIQNNLSSHKYHYLIYCLQSSLRILKFGYPSSNIVITSIPSH